MKIHTGDEVVVITGKDKGKTGSVLRTLPLTSRVVVAGINMRTKHIKATPQRAGQRLQYEASIDVSNIMLVDPKTKKRTRIGFSAGENGKKERLAKRSGEIISRSAKPAAGKAEKSVSKAKKDQEKGPGGKETDIQKVEKPQRKPFWKKIGFGASEVDETGAEEKGVSKKMRGDHSVPEQGQSSSAFHHQRGE